MVKNPKGTGSKSTSDRFGFAVFFLLLGPLILALDCLTDIYWFIKHTYMTDLDIQAQQKKTDKPFGLTNSINRRTFKKMLHYFEMQTTSDMQQIAQFKDVARDIRDYLNVEEGIRTMIYGANEQATDFNKSLFYAYDKKDMHGQSARSGHDNTSQQLVPQEEDGLKVDPPTPATSADVVHEYNIVKQMLENNSLPVSDGSKLDLDSASLYSRKLIIDKKILHSMLVDLQRFRKLLNLKKSFYIFHRNYDGKPPEMAKWHQKVEVRVTQTFRQLNMRRVIDIIGYDPSAYFKGERSL